MSTFDISTFQAKLNQYQGLSKTSLFIVDIDRIGQQNFNSGDLRFFCQATSIPGISFSGVDHKLNTLGHSESMPSGIAMEPVSCIFMLDSKHEVLTFFHRWAQSIVNMNYASINSEVDGKLPYEIGYRDEYSASMTITFYSSEDAKNSYTVTLNNAAPTTIGTVSLSYTDNNQYAILPVSFTYGSMKLSSMITGSSVNESYRTGGLLGLLTTYGGGNGIIGKLFRSNRNGKTIQEVLDKLTKVRNVLDIFK